jgi:hypothetical protein
MLAAPFDGALGRLAKPASGRAGRISSNQQPEWNNGNWDMTRIPAGATFELPRIEGPAVITHIWMTSHSGHSDTLQQLVLRIYWDDADEPSVEAPLGDFFACGHGKRAVVDSYPVQTTSSGSLTCYWRMPFAKSARITLTNDHPTSGTGLYWQVDYLTVTSLPARTPYFCAQYRQEYPCVMGRDYQFLEAEGKGHYVGTVLSVTMSQDGWFGEGDDFFYIDGEEVPSLQGTGSEDYFNDAWGFRERTSAFHGQPLWEGYSAGDRGCAFRWHVLDPVPFERSLRVEIEHKGNFEPPCEGWYVERPDYFSSVAFWYQTGAPKRFASVPPFEKRTPPWTETRAIDRLRDAATWGTQPEVQLVGDRPILFWQNDNPSGTLDVPFDVPAGDRFAVRARVVTSCDYGIFDVLVDGEPVVREGDLYTSDIGTRELNLGVREMSAGTHVLAFACKGCNRASSRWGIGGPGHYLGVDSLRLLALPPPAERKVRGPEESPWVRREIAASVVAFRALNGRPPESLRELVDSGRLDERYLLDENYQPLESRRDGDTFIVESVGPDGVKGTEDDWTASW